jgi:intracellular sulfur oxidation DsrE/DsrF family protein
MFRNILFVISALFLMLSTNLVMAQGGNTECPVDFVRYDADGNGLGLDAEFGAGSSEITRCLQRRHDVKLLIQANNFCGNSACTRPYALHNIVNVIADYKKTNGMKPGIDYEIAVIVHSGGGTLVLDPDAANPHPAAANNVFDQNVKDLIADGVKFYFCQNTARGMHVHTSELIPGVEYVTAGISALADFQSQGWTYVQP